jgi:hypothetical protein
MAIKKGNKKLARLLAEDSDDEEIAVPSASAALPGSSKPWLHELKSYLDSVDEVPSGMSIAKWWGVCP